MVARTEMEFIHTDCESLSAQLTQQEKQLRHKRRWLMGLPMSNSKQKQLGGPEFLKDRTIPESLLREDDVHYEAIKTFVEKGFGACNVKREHHVVQDSMQLFDLPNDTRNLFSLLDDMTNKGLYLFAEILTGGSIKIEKTRWKIKKIIKECLPEILRNQNYNHQKNISKQISELLKDPHNFRENRRTLLTPASQSYHAAATKVLDGLEDLPFETLSAMRRKLRGIQGYIPQLQPPESGCGRDILIDRVRKSCMEMLSELGEGDVPQEPLAKAMEIAGLSLKLLLGCPSVTEFHQFSPEIEALQIEIAKAIWLLKEKVRFPELKNLQFLLDPNAELSPRRLRAAVRKLLTEYLFECSDMETIPECLSETLAIINRSSRSVPNRFSSKNEIEEEIECVLSVSAQTKQIVLDLLPEHEFDQEFADAYMEDLEESDDDDGYDDDDADDDEQQVVLFQNSRSRYSNDQIEGTGETNPTNSKGNGFSPVLTPSRRLNSDSLGRLAPDHITGMGLVDDSPKNMDGNQYQLGSMRNSGLTNPHLLTLTAHGSGPSAPFSPDGRLNRNYVERQEPPIDSAKPTDFVSSDFSCKEENLMHDKHCRSRNQYLAVQEASDDTSMIAYRLIGHILDEFAQIEGFGLNRGDVSYLRSNGSNPKDSRVKKEEQISYEEDARGSIIIQAVEELIPSFPKSGKEKVKELMGLK